MSQQGLLLFAASVFAYSFLAVAFSSNKLKGSSFLKRLMQSSSAKQPQLIAKQQYVPIVHKGVTTSSTTFLNTVNKIYLNNPKTVFQFQVKDNSHKDFNDDIKCVINEIIPGASKLTLQDLQIDALSGGITNLLYIVHLIPLELKVIIRLFGHGTSKFVDRNTENIVFSSLSQANISPIFYGLFTNGRVEGYLPYRVLTPEETKHSKYIPLIARGVSELHNQKLTNISTELCGWGMLETFLYLAQDTILKASTCNTNTNTTTSTTVNNNIDIATTSSFSSNNPYNYNHAFLNQDSLLIHHMAITRMMKEYEWLKPEIISYLSMSSSYSAFKSKQQQQSLPYTSSKGSMYSSNSTTTTSPSIGYTNNSLNDTTSHNTNTKSFFEWRGFAFGLEKVLAHNDLLAGNLLYNHDDDDDDDEGDRNEANYSTPIVTATTITAAGTTATTTTTVAATSSSTMHKQKLTKNPTIEKNKKTLVLIDFEYAGYNFRAWDIANHFCESAGFDANFQKDFISRNERMLFYSRYIQSCVKLMESELQNHVTSSGSDGGDDDENDRKDDYIYKEDERGKENNFMNTRKSSSSSSPPTSSSAPKSSSSSSSSSSCKLPPPPVVPIDLAYINDLLRREGMEEFLSHYHFDSFAESFSSLNTRTSSSSSTSTSATPVKSSPPSSSSSSSYFQTLLSPVSSSTDIANSSSSSSSSSCLSHSSVSLTMTEEKDLLQFLLGLDDIVCKFTLISHLFWGSWAIMQAANSQIDFDFAGYSLRRYKGYFYHKQLFFSFNNSHSSHSNRSNSNKKY